MIIGISSKIGCGKTTLSNMFLKRHPEYDRIGFADVVKEECSRIFNYPIEWNYSEEGKEISVFNELLPVKSMTVREVLQWWGTDVCRAKDPDYWVNKMQEKALTVYMKDPLVDVPKIIIDDVRFINEAEWVKSKGGKIVRLNPYPEWKPGKFSDHESEINLDFYNGFDLVLSPKFGELRSCLLEIEKLIDTKYQKE